MPLLDSDFNNFATALTRRFADRSKGLDPDSRRIIAARPSDHILAGFLTPVRSDQPFPISAEASEQETEVDAALADDLPRDSAYEQTSIGLEWIVALDEMLAGVLID